MQVNDNNLITGNIETVTINIVAFIKILTENKIYQIVHKEFLPIKALKVKISHLTMGISI